MKIKQIKKPVIFFILLIAVNTVIFSFDSEAGIHLGLEFGNLFERYSDQGDSIESYTSAIGLSFSSYRFFGESSNFGIFAHGFFAGTAYNSVTTNGVTINNNFGNYSFVPFRVGIVIGPAFRHNISENLTLHYAIGINWLWSIFSYEESFPFYNKVTYDVEQTDLGIGGDIGIKLEIDGTAFIMIGSIVTVDFLQFKSVETSLGDTSSGVVKDFFAFSVRPYISFGLNISYTYPVLQSP
ncbi:MAG: hypothetical protein LBI28_04220 [Treponema sp.]|jgi:hypothetical protein|nr:hypothetical protein [Treponema sp.]